MLETNQSTKAEYIQYLYQFKAKKALSVIDFSFKKIYFKRHYFLSFSIFKNEKNVKKVDEGSNSLVESNLKYLDGLSLVVQSKQTNFMAYLTMGRSYCQIEDYKQASIYLKPCLNWSDPEYQTLARFYLGFALSKQKEPFDSYPRQIYFYISNGLQLFTTNLTKSLSSKKIDLIAKDKYSIFNTVFLEGFIVLGKIKIEHKISEKTISAENTFK